MHSSTGSITTALLLLDPGAERTWRFASETVRDGELRQRFGVGLERLPEQVRLVGPGAFGEGILQLDDTTLVLAAAATATSDGPVAGEQASRTTFVLIDLLAPDELLQLGYPYGLIDLHVVAEGAQAEEPSLAIPGLAGSPVIFGWAAPEFGREMLHGLLPVVAFSALLLLLLIGLIALDLVKASRRLEDSHSALSISQASLASSERRFRDIAEAASDSLWETDGQLRLVYLSERFERVTQHTASQWLGLPLDELLQAETEDIAQWLRRQGGKTLCCQYSDRNGDVRICRVASDHGGREMCRLQRHRQRHYRGGQGRHRWSICPCTTR